MPLRYNILVSAYACEPNRGSEPGVGWNWVVEIANRGHYVFVITRSNNKEKIESASFDKSKIAFYYYDLPNCLLKFKKIFGVHIYYFLWQLGILNCAFKIIRSRHIHAVHHLTFVSLRKPTFVSFLGKPFFYGPVGGGEEANYKLIKDLPLKCQFIEFVRFVLNRIVKFNPFQLWSFYKAKMIATTTKETFFLLPKAFQHKAIQQPAIGIPCNDSIQKKPLPKNSIKLLFIGQFIYWKGVELVLRTLSSLRVKNDNVSLTLVGKGPFKRKLLELIDELDLVNYVNWIDWIEQDRLNDIYNEHQFFVFPSLHDSGGMVVLEALSKGLPVVCLDLGGPGLIVNESCGIKVDVSEKDNGQIVEELANGILSLYNDKEKYTQLSINAQLRANEFTWKRVVANYYEHLEKKLASYYK